MKRLPLVILCLALALVTVVTGCGGAQRYDGRLTAADSLMQRAPDSALAIVEGIVRDSLTHDGDRAYHDLLLTQARYKCHITPTSDSAIGRALDYYRSHDDEWDKLTNAYIYMGAVMEELGRVDSAIYYYKIAEAVAAPNDYFNQGYVKTRMGALYRDHYAIDGREILKYEEALVCFEQAGERQRQLMCMMNLGSLYRLKTPEKSVKMLQDAMELALQLQDSARYVRSQQFLVMTYYAQKKYQQAHRLIQDILERSDDPDRLGAEFLTHAAAVYARLGMPDSAQRLIDPLFNQPLNGVVEEMSYLESLAEIALARGDTSKYRSITDKYTHMNDSLLALDASIKIMQTEDNIDTIFQQQVKKKHAVATRRLTLVIVLFLALLTAVVVLSYRRQHRYDHLIADLRETADTHLSELAELRVKLGELDITDSKLKDCIESHWSLMGEIIDECNHHTDGKLVEKLKKLLQYEGKNRDLWLQLNDYIDLKHHHIISRIVKEHPELNERDQLLLALSTLDFSCAQIAIIMGYANPSSIGVMRARLAKKMGLDVTLMQYIHENVHQ